MKYLIILILISGINAQIHQHPHYFDELDIQVREKQISESDAILAKFRYAFDRQKKTDNEIIKCLTPLIREYKNHRNQMPLEAINFIESKLKKSKKKSLVSYVSPSGLFNINYETSGPDSVSNIDDNSNLIPDYVENIANYFDFSFNAEVTVGGYKNPIPDGLKYQVYIENLGGGFYGYADDDGFTTSITIHNSFIGFPNNTDPEGKELGAAKVTAAHEFKHAVQFATDLIQWNGPEYWVELDATWAEEFVYDYVNDYYNYLTSNSCQITNPSLRLNDVSNSGSYYDVIWNLYLTQKFGNQILNQFWVRRELQNGESVLNTYSNVLQQNGSTLAKAISEYTGWNFMTGSRASSQYGYEEAAFYPTSHIYDDIQSKTDTVFSGIITAFASRHYTLDIRDALYAKIKLDADPNLELLVLVELVSGSVKSFQLTGSSSLLLNTRLDQVKTVGILPIGIMAIGPTTNFEFRLTYLDELNSANNLFSIYRSSIKSGMEINHDLIAPGTNTEFTIFNLLGQRISSGQLQVNTNSTEIKFPPRLARGIYFIRVDINGVIETQRFVTF